MEVMNSTEFEQKDVLVGGSGKTGKFTVNDDPHLMSMLSTSLYANPLRTMIQEICFNAWMLTAWATAKTSRLMFTSMRPQV